MSQRTAIALLSGGLDSATAAALALEQGDRVIGLSFDYGQRHRRELDAAASVAQQLGLAEHHCIAVNLASWGGSALTDTSISIPSEGVQEGVIPTTYVPGRNTVFIAIGLSLAEARGAERLVLGVNAVDYSGYPDCRDDTIKAMQLALNLGMEARFVLHTPLMWLDKAATWEMAKTLGGDPLINVVREHTHTCYNGDRSNLHEWGYGCGICPACEIRAKGYAAYST